MDQRFQSSGIAILLTALFSLQSTAQDAPAGTGTYEGDGLKLTLSAGDDGKLSGTVTLGDRKFPVAAAAEGAAIKGTFDADGTAYPFVLKSDAAAGFTFDSDGNAYKLKRRSNNPLLKPKKPNPLAGGPPKPAPPAPPPPPAPVDPYVGTFTNAEGMTVTISAGPAGTYDAAVSGEGHKTTVKLAAGDKGLSGVMTEGDEKVRVTAVMERDVLMVSADGETIEFRRQQTTPRDADAPPPAGEPEPRRPPADGPVPPRDADEPRAARLQGGGVLLKPGFVADRTTIGGDAIQFLVPEGWQIHGGIAWRQHPQYPAYFDFSIASADGSCAVTYFPDEPLIWFAQEDPTFPPGSSYLGNRVARPVLPADYVRTEFTARRPGARFGQPEDMPKIAAACLEAYGTAPGIQTEMRAAKVRLSYESHGRPTEEDVYCVLEYVSWNAAGKAMLGWKPNVLYSFRAPAGRLDARTPMMQTVASSMKVELPWLNKYLQLKEVLQKQGMDAIAEAGKRAAIVSKLNDEILQIRREVYENQQKAFDKANAAWCEYIGGMATHHNSRTGSNVSAPNGATVFQKGGEYYYTFDPNDPRTQDMQRVGG